MKTFEQLQNEVLNWAHAKRIIKVEVHQAAAQLRKFNEEVDEFRAAFQKYFESRAGLHDVEDELGDVLVTIINTAACLNIDPVSCLNRAYNKISGRKGRTVDGVFVKDVVSN